MENSDITANRCSGNQQNQFVITGRGGSQIRCSLSQLGNLFCATT
uniref:Uncharacterized protein n=1 Tax=Planktothrix agardhii TaxID=1160 RepID=A0A1J1JLQ9_PLAAG|nr:protein of unknown function [Planktothrix agardhii]